MFFRQVPSQCQRCFKLRRSRDHAFFKAMESCAEHELTVHPIITYSQPVVAVRFGHLYKGNTNQRDVEGRPSIVTQLYHQLIAEEPQRCAEARHPDSCLQSALFFCRGEGETLPADQGDGKSTPRRAPARSGVGWPWPQLMETTGAHDWTVTGWLLPWKVTFAAVQVKVVTFARYKYCRHRVADHAQCGSLCAALYV